MLRPKRHKAPVHQAPRAPQRSNPFYHTNRWRRESKAFIAITDGYCVMCKAKGILTPATVTDHIIPLAVCNDPWDMTNWQPLCDKCNREKGRTSDKATIAKYNKR